MPSLVALKNVFFYQTIVPKRSNSNREQIPSIDFSTARRPLLPSNTNSNPTSETTERCHEDDESTLDLESQDSRSEKAYQERGFRIDARIISDATIGLSDGLTVPFALTAGLSALGDTRTVVFAGFAELTAGAISMGLGGWLGAKSELASYNAKRDEAIERIETDLQGLMIELMKVFEPFNLPKNTLEDLSTSLSQSPRLAEFVMQFLHCEEEPSTSRALQSGATIGAGYFFGGLVPLLPYLFVANVATGLYISIGAMIITLFCFGYVKTSAVIGFKGGKCINASCWGGLQMVVVGSLAAAAAMALMKAIA